MSQARQRTLLLSLGFCLAVAATFIFGYRAGHKVRHVRWQEETVQPWMSVPFVAHAHHAREALLFQAIHLPPNPHDHRPIRDIARDMKVPSSELVRELERAIASANVPEAVPAFPENRTPPR